AGIVVTATACANTIIGDAPRMDGGSPGGMVPPPPTGGGPTATKAPTSPADFPPDTYVPAACTGVSGASPRTLCVDGLNASGTEDGTAQHPFKTVGAVVAVLQNGDVIQVARGRYNESLVVTGVQLSLVGGFPGAESAADYAGGAGG